MKASYKRLFKMLIDKDMTKKELIKGAGISWTTITKLNKGQNVYVDVLIKICTFLKCNIEDIDTKLEDHAYDDHRYAVMSDFVMHPTTYMRKINGSWRQQRQTKEWEPF